jgi:hypothetical protein
MNKVINDAGIMRPTFGPLGMSGSFVSEGSLGKNEHIVEILLV